MASKNNPENRGQETVLRVYNGKSVKPVRYINGKSNFIAGIYENGDLVVDTSTGSVIPYQDI